MQNSGQLTTYAVRNHTPEGKVFEKLWKAKSEAEAHRKNVDGFPSNAVEYIRECNGSDEGKFRNGTRQLHEDEERPFDIGYVIEYSGVETIKATDIHEAKDKLNMKIVDSFDEFTAGKADYRTFRS